MDPDKGDDDVNVNVITSPSGTKEINDNKKRWKNYWKNIKGFEYVGDYMIYGWTDNEGKLFLKHVNDIKILLKLSNNSMFTFMRVGIIHLQDKAKHMEFARDISLLPMYGDLVGRENKALVKQLTEDKIVIGMIRITSQDLNSYEFTNILGNDEIAQYALTLSLTSGERNDQPIIRLSGDLKTTAAVLNRLSKRDNLKYLIVNGGKKLMLVEDVITLAMGKSYKYRVPSDRISGGKLQAITNTVWTRNMIRVLTYQATSYKNKKQNNNLVMAWSDFIIKYSWAYIWRNTIGLEKIGDFFAPTGWYTRIGKDLNQFDIGHAIRNLVQRAQKLKILLLSGSDVIYDLLENRRLHAYTIREANNLLRDISKNMTSALKQSGGKYPIPAGPYREATHALMKIAKEAGTKKFTNIQKAIMNSMMVKGDNVFNKMIKDTYEASVSKRGWLWENILTHAAQTRGSNIDFVIDVTNDKQKGYKGQLERAIRRPIGIVTIDNEFLGLRLMYPYELHKPFMFHYIIKGEIHYVMLADDADAIFDRLRRVGGHFGVLALRYGGRRMDNMGSYFDG